MSIYVIRGSNLRENCYKVGFTTTSKIKLLQRYGTYYTETDLKYFHNFENYREIEKCII